MIIAVTGSEGFVGSKIVSALLTEGHEVIKLDLSLGIDITKEGDSNRIPYFEVMIHLAAKSFVPDSYIIPRDFYFTNYVGTLNMLEVCRKYNARFIFTSSYVYGNPEYLPIDENHPVVAFNPYADSKILGENLCRSYFKFFDVKSTIVRPFNIYGKGQHSTFLISTIFEQAKTGNIILQSSKPKRDYVYIDDMVSAYLKIIHYENNKVEVFNIGSGTSYSVKEITEIVNYNLNNALNIKFTDIERPNEVPNTIANIEKAKKYLNWEPRVTLEEGINIYFNE